MYSSVFVTKTCDFYIGAEPRLLSIMVGMEFLKYGTRVSCHQDGFHNSGAPADKG